jgi:zinc protease
MTTTLPHSGNVTRHVLPNGLTLLVYETPHTASVVLSGSLSGGSLYQASQGHQGGLAHMTAQALLLGTHTLSFEVLHTELEAVGADLHLNSGVHKVGFTGKSLAEDLPLLVDLLADALREPAFPPEQIERLRGERLTALNYLEQDISYQAGTSFRRRLYPAHHPYHHPVRGTLASIAALQRDDLAAFHDRVYGPRGMILSIAGAVSAEQVVQTVEAAFADWENPRQRLDVDLPAIDLTPFAAREAVAIPGKLQTEILMGTFGPSRQSPDYQAANLGNSILGVFGMMGRIGDVVREREGLAYYAGSQLNSGLGPASWRVSAGVDPDDVERTIDLCLNEIQRLTTEPVSPDDLADNQSYFVGRLPLQLENNDGIAAVLHSLEMYNLGLDYLKTYRETIYSVTPQDILQTAQRYLDPQRLVIVVAGP